MEKLLRKKSFFFCLTGDVHNEKSHDFTRNKIAKGKMMNQLPIKIFQQKPTLWAFVQLFGNDSHARAFGHKMRIDVQYIDRIPYFHQ